MEESFSHLITSIAHWKFEIVSSIVIGLIEVGIIYPIYRSWKKHHKKDHDIIDKLDERIKALENR